MAKRKIERIKANSKTEMKKHNGIKILLILAIGIFQNGNAQTIGTIDPTPKVPKVATLQQPNIINTNKGTKTPNLPNIYKPKLSTQQKNQMLIQQADTQIQQRRIQSRQIVKEALYEFETNTTNGININYNLPSKQNEKGANYYRQAYNNLLQMNENKFSIKKATFIIENAFYENQKNYSEYENYIKNAGNFIKQAIKEQGFDENNNIVKNLNIYQFISDTVSVGNQKHLPYKYNFNDYFGKKDWSKMFVQKLMFEGTGQCNSMPRLYLILAEEIKVNSFLAFAPNHSFIKFQDKKGDWYNAELTSGALLTDAFLIRSGFVKAEAIFKGAYTQPQTSKQLMAQILIDLASGYINKYGYDNFVKQIINKSLELNPNGVNGNLVKFNLLLKNMEYVAKQLQIQNPNQLKKYPKALNLFNQLAKQDQKIKSIGFEKMSKEDYQNWINSMVQGEKEQAKKNKKEFLNNILKQHKIKD